MHYQTAFSELLDFISRSRDFVVDNSSQFHSGKNALFQFSDDHFNSYRTLIEKYEMNARSTIESLAVTLVTKHQIPGFSLYPVDESILARCPGITASQLRKNAFELILEKDHIRTGIVFYISDDGEYYKRFTDGVYNVDRLILYLIFIYLLL